ncbi:Hypothetical protein PBC10988_12370 [Planctomycetales bacterium 10988]|nr:Hypothetical protein PBC10988_12370 [Planctomycetales bacterium 10988]
MATPWESVLAGISIFTDLDPERRKALVHVLPQLSAPPLPLWNDLLAGLGELLAKWPAESEQRSVVLSALIRPIVAQLQRVPQHLRQTLEQKNEYTAQLEATIARLAEIYRSLGKEHPERHQILALLAGCGTTFALKTFVDLIVSDPPAKDAQVDLSFTPLFQQKDLPVDCLYPALFGALAHERVATPVLDLANHLRRTGQVENHPAAGRADQLASLFSELAEHMRRLEEHPTEYADNAQQLSEMVAHAVGLGVATADALGWLGKKEHVGVLRKALDIGHRRLRAEAAVALGRLEENTGVEILLELSADPGSRLRAISYLEELEKADEIPEEHRSPVARAEGELALFLSQPSQYGFPPTQFDCLDQRTLRWPGSEMATECFLFDYTYQFPQGELNRVGIVGPLTYSLRMPVDDLSLAELYGLYCGWQTEHDEIQSFKPQEVAEQYRQQIQESEVWLIEKGYKSPALLRVVDFFGQIFYLFGAVYEEEPGYLILDEDGQILWKPQSGSWKHFEPDQMVAMHVGLKILRQFNPEEDLFFRSEVTS